MSNSFDGINVNEINDNEQNFDALVENKENTGLMIKYRRQNETDELNAQGDTSTPLFRQLSFGKQIDIAQEDDISLQLNIQQKLFRDANPHKFNDQSCNRNANQPKVSFETRIQYKKPKQQYIKEFKVEGSQSRISQEIQKRIEVHQNCQRQCNLYEGSKLIKNYCHYCDDKKKINSKIMNELLLKSSFMQNKQSRRKLSYQTLEQLQINFKNSVPLIESQKVYINILEEDLKQYKNVHNIQKQAYEENDGLINKLQNKIKDLEAYVDLIFTGHSHYIQKTKKMILENSILLYDHKIAFYELKQCQGIDQLLQKKCCILYDNLSQIIEDNELLIKNLNSENIYLPKKLELLSVTQENNQLALLQKVQILENDNNTYYESDRMSKNALIILQARNNQLNDDLQKVCQDDMKNGGLKNTVKRLLEFQKQISLHEDKEQSMQKQIKLLQQELKCIAENNIQTLQQMNNFKTFIINQFDLNNKENNPKTIQDFVNQIEKQCTEMFQTNKQLNQELSVTKKKLEIKQAQILNNTDGCINEYNDLINRRGDLLNLKNEREQMNQQTKEINQQSIEEIKKLKLIHQKDKQNYEKEISQIIMKNHQLSQKIQQLEFQQSPSTLIRKSQKQDQINDEQTFLELIEKVCDLILQKNYKREILSQNSQDLINDLLGDNFSNVIQKYESILQEYQIKEQSIQDDLSQQIAQTNAYIHYGIHLSDLLLTLMDLISQKKDDKFLLKLLKRMDVVLSAERASINNVNMELKATILFQPKGVENSYDENETGIISKDELLKKIIINDKIQSEDEEVESASETDSVDTNYLSQIKTFKKQDSPQIIDLQMIDLQRFKTKDIDQLQQNRDDFLQMMLMQAISIEEILYDGQQQFEYQKQQMEIIAEESSVDFDDKDEQIRCSPSKQEL